MLDDPKFGPNWGAANNASEDRSEVVRLPIDSDKTNVEMPADLLLTGLDFARERDDLVLTDASGRTIIIEDFYLQDPPPDLVLDSGGILRGDLVARLGGPLAPGQVAQEGEPLAVQPIGTVETAQGEVFVIRANGVRETLDQGGAVFQGDIIETGGDGAVGVLFADETTLSLGVDSQMALDEMVYDPGNQEGSMSLSLVSGVFTFVSGEIAKTGVDAMMVNTPTATIGIRGTAGGGSTDAQGALTFSLADEVGNVVGEVTITNAAGTQTLNQPGQATIVVSFNTAPSETFTMTPREFGQAFGSAFKVLPNADRAVAPEFKEQANQAYQQLRRDIEENQNQPEEDEEVTEEETNSVEDVAEEATDESEEFADEVVEEAVEEEEVLEEEVVEEVSEEEAAEGEAEGEEALAEGEGQVAEDDAALEDDTEAQDQQQASEDDPGANADAESGDEQLAETDDQDGEDTGLEAGDQPAEAPIGDAEGVQEATAPSDDADGGVDQGPVDSGIGANPSDDDGSNAEPDVSSDSGEEVASGDDPAGDTDPNFTDPGAPEALARGVTTETPTVPTTPDLTGPGITQPDPVQPITINDPGGAPDPQTGGSDDDDQDDGDDGRRNDGAQGDGEADDDGQADVDGVDGENTTPDQIADVGESPTSGPGVDTQGGGQNSVGIEDSTPSTTNFGPGDGVSNVFAPEFKGFAGTAAIGLQGDLNDEINDPINRVLEQEEEDRREIEERNDGTIEEEDVFEELLEGEGEEELEDIEELLEEIEELLEDAQEDLQEDAEEAEEQAEQEAQEEAEEEAEEEDDDRAEEAAAAAAEEEEEETGDTYSGSAIDGYISGATVWADADGDGIRDANEAFDVTDSEGNFTLVNATGPLVMTGGTDISTGLAFEGTLTAPEGSTVVTPLTTVMKALIDSGQAANAEAAGDILVNNLGLPGGIDFTNYDPIEESLSSDSAAADNARSVMAQAVKVQNTIIQAAAVLDGAGANADDAFSAVADSLANALAMGYDIDNSSNLQSIISNAASDGSVAGSIDSQKVSDAASSAASVIASSNGSISDLIASGDDGLLLLTELAKIAVVAQNDAKDEIASATSSGAPQGFSNLSSNFTGSALTDRHSQAASEVQQVVTDDQANNLQDTDPTTGNDQIFGTSGADNFDGLAGDDRIFGLGGDDVLDGGADNDEVVGGRGDDTIFLSAGNDEYVGGAGSDTLDTTSFSNITINLATKTAQNIATGAGSDTVLGIENVIAGSGSDHITGNEQSNTITAGDGYDTLIGGAGNDVLDGGDQLDTVEYSDATSGVTVNLGLTNAQFVGGGRGFDQILNIENLTGSDHDDRLTGSDVANTIFGGEGNDTIVGGGGQDWIFGDDGDDVITWDSSDIGGGVDGGADTDRLIIEDNTFDLRQSNVQNTLDNFEQLDLNGDTALDLDDTGVIAITDSNNTLRILGESGDSINTNSPWDFDGTSTIAGQVYAHYSNGSASIQVDVDIDQTGINVSPDLDSAGVNNFSAIVEDSPGGGGELVSALLGTGETDVFSNVDLGMAVFGADTTNGTWQYQLGGQGGWTDVPAVSATNALLLAHDASLRFVPNADYTGSASISYRAWDYTQGSEGFTFDTSGFLTGNGEAFSTGTASSSITVTNTVDPPSLDINTGVNSVQGTVTITAAMLSASDPDDDHRYQVLSEPNGILRLSDGMGGFTIFDVSNSDEAEDSTEFFGEFTQADINAGRLEYISPSGSTVVDSFDFRLVDSAANGDDRFYASNTFTLGLTDVPDWTGNGENNYFNNSDNWDTAVVPGVGNTAIMDNANAAVTGGAVSVDKLVLTETTLTISGGTFNIAQDTVFGTNTNLNLNGGTIGGAGAWDIDGGNFNWSSGTIAAGGTLNLADGGSATPGGALTVDGTLNIDGGEIVFSGNAIGGDGLIDIDGRAVIRGASSFDGGVTVQSGGEFKIQKGTNSTSTFTMDGDFVNNGQLILTRTGSTSGGAANFVVDTNGSLTNAASGEIISENIAGGSRGIFGSMTNNGTITANSNLSIGDASSTFTTSSGTLNATGTRVITVNAGTTVFGSGTVLSGTGTLTFAGTALLTLATTYAHTGSTSLDFTGGVTVQGPGTWNNQTSFTLYGTDDVFNVAVNNAAGGTMVFNQLNSLNSNVTFNEDLTNAGKLEFNSIGVSGSSFAGITIGADNTLINTGEIEANSFGTTGSYIVGAVTNQGLIDVNRDMLIENSGQVFDTQAGSIDIDAGEYLTIGNGTVYLGSSTSLSGTGIFRFGSANGQAIEINLQQNYTHGGTTFDFFGAVTVNGTNTTWTNNHDLKIYGDNDVFNVAFINNAGTLTLEQQNSLNSNTTFNAGITNYGLIDITSFGTSGSAFAGLTMGNSSVLLNTSDGEIQASSAGSTGSRIVGTLTNEGLIDVNDEMVIVNIGTTFTNVDGTIDVDTNHILTIDGGTVDFGTDTVMQGLGTVQFGSSVNQVVTLNMAEAYDHQGSAFNFQGEVTVTGEDLTNSHDLLLWGSNDTFEADLINDTDGTVTFQQRASNNADTQFSADFTNNGTVQLTHVSASGSSHAGFTMGTGTTFTNGSTGTVLSTSAGSIGGLITGAVVNQGTFDLDDDMRINNTGTTFTNTDGTIDVASGHVLTIQSGTVAFGTDTVTTGAGRMFFGLSAADDITINLVEAYDYSGLTFDFIGDVTVTGNTWTNSDSLKLYDSDDVFDTTVINDTDGTIIFEQRSSNNANVTFNDTFTNNGLVQLTSLSTSGSSLAGFNMAGVAIMVNNGTIQSTSTGSIGGYIDGTLTNNGTIDVDDDMTIVNTGRTFTTTDGAIDVESGHALTIQSGTVDIGTDTSFSGSGDIRFGSTVDDAVTINLVEAYDHQGADLVFQGDVTIQGATFTNSHSITMTGSDDIWATQLVNDIDGTVIFQQNTSLNSDTQFTADFTNNGTVITTTGGNSGSSYGGFTMVGETTFYNTGTWQTLSSGSIGNRIVGNITNTGIIDVDQKATVVNTDKVFDTIDGTIDVAANSRPLIISGGEVRLGIDTTTTGAGTIQFGSSSNEDVAITLSEAFDHDGVKFDFVGDVTVSGSTWTNSRDLTLYGSDDIFNSSFVNDTDGTLTIRQQNSLDANPTFNAGITNNGLINLTTVGNSGSSFAALTMGSSSVLTNSSTGTIRASSSDSGFGNRIFGTLVNQGTIEANQNIVIDNTANTFDTIDGTITTGGGDVFQVANGTMSVGLDTSFTGSGTIQLGDTVNKAVTLNLAEDFTHAASNLDFLGDITVSGSGTFINGTILDLYGSDDVFNTGFTNSSDGTVRIEQRNTNDANVTFNQDITNAGQFNFVTVSLTGSSLSRITLGADDSFNNASGGTLNFNNLETGILAGAVNNQGTINAAQSATIGQAGSSVHTSSGTIDITGAKTLTMLGSSLTTSSTSIIEGTGTLNTSGLSTFQNSGTWRPGGDDAYGFLNFTGNVDQTDTAVLDIDVGSSTQHDKLVVTGAFDLDGTLAISDQAGIGYSDGVVLDVLSATSFTGAFDDITGTLVTGDTNFMLVPVFSATALNLEAREVDLTGSDLTAGSTDQNLLGTSGNDTITGAGGDDVMMGLAGDDTLTIADANFDFIDGGLGNDTLALNFDLDLTTIRDDLILNMEMIDISGGSNITLTMNSDDVFGLSDGDNGLTAAASDNAIIVLGSAGDTLDLGSEWSDSGSDETINAQGYSVYTHASGARVLANDDMTVDLGGQILD